MCAGGPRSCGKRGVVEEPEDQAGSAALGSVCRVGAGAVGLGLPGQMAPNAVGSHRTVVDPARSRNGQLS